MIPRLVRAAALAAIAILAGAAPAMAVPSLIATRAALDPVTGEYVAFVGGIDENGRSLKASGVEVVPSGELQPLVSSEQSFSDWAALASEQNAAWRPPLAVGLVYLWIKNVPRGVLDGIHAFFQRLPGRTTVLPTVYGRMRQGRASLIAADISRLDEEVPPLEDYRPNMIDAVRLDLADLAVNPASIKVLLLVTDGRDFADPKGQGPGDFAALGRDLRHAGVTLLLVGYPPSSDPLQSSENLRGLHEAAGGYLRVLEQPEDLENTLESLGQAIADLQQVRFAIPWTWRAFGASHRVSFRITTNGGHRLNLDAGAVDVAASSFLKVAGLVVVLVVMFLGFGFVRWRRGAREVDADADAGDEDDERGQEEEAILVAVHALVRRGTSPGRVVEELTRSFSEGVDYLVDVDPSALNDQRFPYFRTKAGRQRLQEIRDLLAKKSALVPKLGTVVVQVLAGAISDGTSPDAAAELIAARSAVDEWTSFAGMGLQKLAEALRSASRVHASLGTPKARGLAVAVQDALRLRGTARGGTTVGWLVRAGGPGTRGETLRIKGGRVTLGTAPSCQIKLAPGPAAAAEHAEIAFDSDEFVLTPKGGAVSVEGQPVDRRHVLVDGETIQMERVLFVFKSAAVGSLLPQVSRTARINARRRSR